MMNTFEHNRSIFKRINSCNLLEKQDMKHQEMQDKDTWLFCGYLTLLNLKG
jgi:hypothetical protein